MALRKLTQAQMDGMTAEEILRHNRELQLQQEAFSTYRYARCPLCTLHMSSQVAPEKRCVCQAAEAAGIEIPPIQPTQVNGRFISVKALNVYRRALMNHGFLSPRKITTKRAYQV